MARVALITGASRGIGAATALLLAKHGYRVVVNHRASAPQAEEVVATIAAAGGEAVAIKADVTVPGDVTAMVDEIDRRWGGTDVLVHNALTPFAITSFAELTWEQLGGKLDSELHAAFLMTKAVVPGMISRGYGRLIYLSTGLSRHAARGDDHAGHRQGGPGPVRAVRRSGAGAARDHRQPRRTGHGGGDQGDRAIDGRADARARRGHADGTAGPSRRCRQDGGVPGERGFRLHHRPLPPGQRRALQWTERNARAHFRDRKERPCRRCTRSIWPTSGVVSTKN